MSAAVIALQLRALCLGQGYVISTVAGGGTCAAGLGNGGQALNACLNSPESVALDSAGHLYIADTANNMIRKVDATTGKISVVAGTGVAGFSGDGGAATAAQLYAPQGVEIGRANV